MITLKETAERCNLGQNKRFKMPIRAMGLLLLISQRPVTMSFDQVKINQITN